MYSFQVMETFAGAPLNLVSGIGDMELVLQGGNLMLYTATRAGGGVLAIDVDAAMMLVDQEQLAPGLTLPAEATLDMITVGGAAHLVVSGANQAGVQAYQLGAGGAMTAPVQLAGSVAGVIAAQAVVQVGGVTYFYAARAGESTIQCHSVAANGTMTFGSSRVLDAAHPGVDIGSMTAVTVGGETYLVALSLEADVVRSFRVGPGGALAAPVMLGAPQGLGIADPSDVKVVSMAGVTYLLVAATGSSSVSVIAVGPGGQMSVADHVVDTLDTRFQGVQTLATATIGDRVFVIAGGGDDGLTLMTLTPDGGLVLVATQLQVPGLALHNITAMTARVVDGEIDLFVAGEGTGITRLRLDPGDLAPVQSGGDDADTLTGSDAGDMISGGAGDDVLSGGAGADILLDGDGSDVLYGGAGADIFVLDADQTTDTLADFQLGIDRIDLSGWGRVYAIADLVITATATGAMISYQGETLLIQSANGLPIQPGVFRTQDLFPLWHARPELSEADMITGTIQTDLLEGGTGDDHFLITVGGDTILGGDGFDCISLARATGWVRLNLGVNGQHNSIAQGQTYISIEAAIGSVYGDLLTGSEAANLLDGADGNDRLTGLGGSDSLMGGNGSDILNGGTGADRLDGGAGRDRVSYRDAVTGVVVDMADLSRNTGEAAGDVFLGIEDVEGGIMGDVIFGDTQANALYGQEGDDSLAGRVGNDSLYGGDGNDTLTGGAGADRLEGGAGIDTAAYGDNPAAIRIDLLTPALSTGDALGDTFAGVEAFSLTGWGDTFLGNTEANRAHGLGGNDTLNGRAGDDGLFGGAGSDSLSGEDGNDTLAGGAGADKLYGGAGRDMVSYGDALAGVRVDLTSTKANSGDAAGDLFLSIEDIGGSGLADVLLGDAYANLLRGEAGADSLWGRAGNDSLSGGDGNDTLVGGAGADALDGGAGVDTVAYTDAVRGVWVDLVTPALNTGDAAGDVFAGVENLSGSGYGDTLAGDGAANLLIGGAGNDSLDGRDGDDTLEGGDGNDTLLAGVGTDRFDGGLGTDVVSYAGQAAVVIDLAAPGLNGGAAAGDTFLSVEQIIATGFDDTLAGDALANHLRGDGGNDRLAGRAGNDLLYGGEGDDTLAGGAGADWLDGGAGMDLVSYADALAGVKVDLAASRWNTGDAKGDVLVGIEALAGSGFADILLGDTLVNRFDGEAGADSLWGRAGNDSLSGGDGNDTLVGGAGADALGGGAGVDTVAYTDAVRGVWVDLVTPALNTGDAVGDVFVGVENLSGSGYGDTLAGDGAANLLAGGAGNDSLDGRDGDDTLEGGTGRDTLTGGEGVDTVSYLSARAAVTVNLVTASACAGDAAGDLFEGIEQFILSGYNDRGFGGDLDDSFRGMSGNDLLSGGGGRDQVFGGTGNDTLQGGDGDDTLTGGAGGDVLDGAAGRDRVSYADAIAGVLADLTNATLNRGDAAKDRYLGVEDLDGSAFADTLAGDAGDNAINGGLGHDSLSGRDGNDTLTGGAGHDTLSGGAGADVFVFHDGLDVILDFADDQDSLALDGALWGGAPPAIEDLLSGAHVTVSGTGLILTLATGAALDIRGIFDASLLADDIVFF